MPDMDLRSLQDDSNEARERRLGEPLTITLDKHNEIVEREREIAAGWMEEADLLASELRRLDADNIALAQYRSYRYELTGEASRWASER